MSDMTPQEDQPLPTSAQPVHAQRARREQVAALPRPDVGVAGKDTKGIHDEVRRVKEIDSTVRVYVKEWIRDSRYPSEADAAAYVTSKFDGRLEPMDLEVSSMPDGTVLVMTRLWNVRGEFSRQDLAEQFEAGINGAEPSLPTKVVARNSRGEHELREYGIKKLVRPAASSSPEA